MRKLSGVPDQFIIRWFRENTTGTVKNLGIGGPIFQQNNDRTSRYHETALFNQPYSPSLLGKYWCQVIDTTADPDQPLMKSNVFTLLAPGDYSGPTCTGVQSVTNTTCADLSNQTDLGETTTTHQSFTTKTALSSAITQTSLTVPAQTPSVVTTPTKISAAQQNPLIIVIAVIGVVIVIISVVAVTAVVILLIKWRQSTKGNKG